jgi:2-keto-4-pentenoate hydratase/2-oxohepta-3-ene-1,7-dioic acid hydratase in catechol pathway
VRVGRIALGERTEFAAEVAPDSWAPLSSVGLHYPDLPSLISDFDSVTAKLAQGGISGVPASELTMKCPIVRPSKMFAIGLNYADHARETGATPPERPVVFAKYPSSLNDPFGTVEIGGDITQQADYEAELAVVVGQRARRVSEDDAYAYVFGYAVVNDVSARDWQRADAQFSRSKSADTFCPIGPWITTADDVADPSQLRISSKVNGEVRQDSTTAQMIFAIPRLISFLSATITLEPGDVILTGTPPGVGLGFKPPRFLVPGDVVECEVEGLGRIRNVFVEASRPDRIRD